MVELSVNTQVPDWAWQAFLSLAKASRRKPEALAAELLQESIIRATDEEMLERSSRSAQRSKFRIRDTERLVRKLRERRRGKATNGKVTKTHAGRS